MVTLNTLLLVGMIAAGVASVATVGFFMLLGVYLSVKEIKKATKEPEESGVLTIPMSSIGGMGGRPITQADVDRARAQMAQMQAAHGGAPAGGCTDSECIDKKEEKPALGGQYL